MRCVFQLKKNRLNNRDLHIIDRRIRDDDFVRTRAALPAILLQQPQPLISRPSCRSLRPPALLRPPGDEPRPQPQTLGLPELPGQSQPPLTRPRHPGGPPPQVSPGSECGAAGPQADHVLGGPVAVSEPHRPRQVRKQ